MKPILIYKGDDTIFADLRRFLTFNIETNLDLTGWKAKFTLGWITKEINDISSKSFEIILSSEETKNLRLGSQSGSIVLTDSIGHIKTITNSIPFEVTTQVVENQYQEINLTIPESSGVDIKLKVGAETVTSVNGMTGDVYLYIPSIDGLATEQQLQQGLNTKQDKGDYATNSRVNEVEGLIPDITPLATKQELQEGLDTKQPTGDYALKSEIPTKVSSFINDANYQTATDVASMIASIPQFELKIVDALPSQGQKMVLYLVPKTSASGDNIYDEYIWIESTSTFELVGSTTVDLSDYYTKTETNELIPTKTSQLTNDSGFITSSYHDSTKQDKLTAGDNITIVNNVISATGGGSGADIVQTTGNSTTAVMSQKATTDMPAFKEVVAPTKMFQAQNAQYCTSYDTFDYEDIKVAQVYCRQAYNSTRINHYRTGDIRYTSAISLYKDSKNYLSIYFNDYKLAIRNTKGGVVINEVNLGAINSGATNINLPANTAWCAETNLQEKTCTFYIMKNGELSVYGEVVDISTWDLSHLDTFNIVFGCSEYTGDSFCYYCLLNEKTEIEKIINTPIEYGKYNCYDTYLKNDIKPLKVTGIYADYTASNVSAGTLIAEYDNFHKVFSFSVPESPTPNYLGLYGRVQDNNHLGQICVIKCKFLEFAEGAGIRYAKQDVYIYEGTKFVYLSTWGVPLFVPELNVEYTFVIRQEKVKPDGRYLLRGVGDFTIEFLDMYYMVPQSANICAETWDGNFFRGTLPFIGTNILFSNNYSQITTSKTGLGVPQYYQTTDSNGNIYMYNGTTWKQISN